jgi:hypothetical protein
MDMVLLCILFLNKNKNSFCIVSRTKLILEVFDVFSLSRLRGQKTTYYPY